MIQTLKEVQTPGKRLRPESPSSKSPSCKTRRKEDGRKQSSSELSAKNEPFLEAFEDNATLAEIVTNHNPDPTEEEIKIEKGFLSKTLVHTSSNNVTDNDESVDYYGDFSEDEDKEEEEVDEARRLLLLKMTPLEVVPGELQFMLGFRHK